MDAAALNLQLRARPVVLEISLTEPPPMADDQGEELGKEEGHASFWDDLDLLRKMKLEEDRDAKAHGSALFQTCCLSGCLA